MLSVLLMAMWPFHMGCIALLALLCHDALAKRRITLSSLFAITTVASIELAMFRLLALITNY